MSFLAFCLPPKAGSTNWLETIEKKYPSKIESDSIYERLPKLSKNRVERFRHEMAKSGQKLLATRNPLDRVFSAWKDKFRFEVCFCEPRFNSL